MFLMPLMVYFSIKNIYIYIITCERNHWKAYWVSKKLFFLVFLYKVYIPLHRDGTDGQATVYWSLKPSGPNLEAVTLDDIGPFHGSVVFLSGQSDTTINITVKADDIPEMNETVTLSLDR